MIAQPFFHRRWKRFSLRTLFVMMTLTCAVVGGWSVYVNPYRLQMQSLDVVNQLQGEAKKEMATGSRFERWLVTRFLGDEAFMRVTDVKLSGDRVDDEAARALAGLIHLESLSLDQTKITDQGAVVLRSMPQLKRLSL